MIERLAPLKVDAFIDHHRFFVIVEADLSKLAGDGEDSPSPDPIRPRSADWWRLPAASSANRSSSGSVQFSERS